ncbi:MAG: hypothetical protein JO250_22145 [Armatimonadetes bacterium]|nr:hypothetical protein [Armatimonadota bacterium]
MQLPRQRPLPRRPALLLSLAALGPLALAAAPRAHAAQTLYVTLRTG